LFLLEALPPSPCHAEETVLGVQVVVLRGGGGSGLVLRQRDGEGMRG